MEHPVVGNGELSRVPRAWVLVGEGLRESVHGLGEGVRLGGGRRSHHRQDKSRQDRYQRQSSSHPAPSCVDSTGHRNQLSGNGPCGPLAVDRLREVGPELSAALSGPDELRRRILTRLVKSVTYLEENRNIELVPVLPHPDVPLRLTAPETCRLQGLPRDASEGR